MVERLELATDRLFFALSHRTRRRMLTQLAGAPEMRVTDLARRYRVSLNAVSKHVAVLERARLVRRRVEGREHFLRLQPRRLAEAERWLVAQREFWTRRLDGLASYLKETEDR
jgi:DNA-binding transcriptional ArsR family regulator